MLLFLQSLTEHQSHLLGGFIALSVLFCGLLGLLLYLDKRGVKTGARQQQKRQPKKNESKGAARKRKNRGHRQKSPSAK